MYNRERCFICFSIDANWIKESTYDGLEYSCPRCGEYTISKDAYEFFEKLDNNAIKKEFDKKALSLAAEMRSKGETPFAIELSPDKRPFVNGHDFLDTYPKDFEEKVYRSLLNLYRNYEPLESFYHNDNNYLFFERDPDKARLVMTALEELDYIIVTDSRSLKEPDSINLTFSGWKAAKKLDEQITNKNTAFIAMWFDDTMDKYVEATITAIKQAGYIPIDIRKVMHNDFIMDKIINLINESRFVIADFSCAPEITVRKKAKNGVRGGVYYEAGYAKGLGLQVIHTCNKTSFDQNRLHFDVQQKSTIIWHDDNGIIKTGNNDYIEYLKEHIIATVGKGKNEVK